MNVMIDGRPHLALISCHHDGTFSYFHEGEWHRKQRSVPREVLADPDLPEGERLRVLGRMAEEGVGPS